MFSTTCPIQLQWEKHDDSYISLDKMGSLLVGHYVRDDVQFLNVALCINMQV